MKFCTKTEAETILLLSRQQPSNIYHQNSQYTVSHRCVDCAEPSIRSPVTSWNLMQLLPLKISKSRWNCNDNIGIVSFKDRTASMQSLLWEAYCTFNVRNLNSSSYLFLCPTKQLRRPYLFIIVFYLLTDFVQLSRTFENDFVGQEIYIISHNMFLWMKMPKWYIFYLILKWNCLYNLNLSSLNVINIC